jgi:hypothetical protein
MNDEQDRFAEIANFTDQIVEPGGPEWRAYLEAQLERGVIFNPTFNIYSASRDLMRARNADWHERYTLPSLTTSTGRAGSITAPIGTTGRPPRRSPGGASTARTCG